MAILRLRKIEVSGLLQLEIAPAMAVGALISLIALLWFSAGQVADLGNALAELAQFTFWLRLHSWHSCWYALWPGGRFWGKPTFRKPSG